MAGLIKKLLGVADAENAFQPIARSSKQDDGSILVEIVARVVVYKDSGSGMFIAQCLDLDYVSAGDTEQDAVNRFVRGLNDTVNSYLEEFGSIEKFVRAPPQCALDDFYSAYLSQKKKPKNVPIDTTLDNAYMRGSLLLQDDFAVA